MNQEALLTRGQSHRERGDGLVEFALILPVLMLILMSVIDFGRAIYAYNVVANCAREGARYGVTAPTDTAGIINVAKSAGVGLDPAQMTVDVTNPTSDSVRVSVSYNFQVVTPLIAQVLAGGGSLVLTSVATMYTGY